MSTGPSWPAGELRDFSPCDSIAVLATWPAEAVVEGKRLLAVAVSADGPALGGRPHPRHGAARRRRRQLEVLSMFRQLPACYLVAALATLARARATRASKEAGSIWAMISPSLTGELKSTKSFWMVPET